MSTNSNEFIVSIKRLTRDMPKRKIVELHKFITYEAFYRIVYRTPVKTGRAREGWKVANKVWAEKRELRIDLGPASGREKKFRVKSTPTMILRRAKAVISKLGPFQVAYIINSVPYIAILETGTSAQAPNGMVRVTIEELKANFSVIR